MVRINYWGAEDNSGGASGITGDPPGASEPRTGGCSDMTDCSTGVEIPQSRDHICECLQEQGKMMLAVVRSLMESAASQVAAQAKGLDKIVSRIERVLKDSLRRQDAIILSVLNAIRTDAQSKVAEQSVRLNLIQGQLGANKQLAPPEKPGPAKPAPGEPVEEEPLQAEPMFDDKGEPPAEPEDKPDDNEKPKKPDDEGDVCGPVKPPSAGDKGTIIYAPWGKERGSKAGLFSEWGQIQLDEARSHYEPAGPFIQAFCQPDPPNAIMDLAKKKRKRWKRPDDGPTE